MAQRRGGQAPANAQNHRSAGALACHTRMRAGFPRVRCMARACPSPYGKRGRFFHRSAGACPPRSLGCTPDEPPSVVCDRQITNRSGSGDPELQRETKTVLFTVARGPVLRVRCMARACPSPYVKRSRSFYRFLLRHLRNVNLRVPRNI